MNLGAIFSNPNVGLGFAVAFGISEALSLIPAVKANGIFQLVQNVLGKLIGVGSGTPPAAS